MIWFVVGATAAAIGCGAWLYATQLPADVTSEREAVLSAPVERLFSLVTDVAAQDRWRSDVDKVSVARDGESWVENGKAGTIQFETIERIRNEVFEISYRSDRGFSGSWRCEFSRQDESATRVRIIEATTTLNPLVRLVGRVVAPPGAHTDLYLADLDRALSDHSDRAGLTLR